MEAIFWSLYLGFHIYYFHYLKNPLQTQEYEKIKQKNVMHLICFWFVDPNEKNHKIIHSNGPGYMCIIFKKTN